MTRPLLLDIPSGVQCFFGEEARVRREILRLVVDVLRGWSYDEIVLPLYDFDEVFTRGGRPGELPDVYRFIGRDGEVLALRPDFTALVAKVVVSRFSQTELPLRLFYSGEVLRHQPPRAGQQEEFFQVGLEHFGGGAEADIEVLLVASEALAALGIEDALFTLGDVGVTLGILSGVQATEAERTEAITAMRRHDRRHLRRVLGDDRAKPLVELIALSGGFEMLERAKALVNSEESERALARLVRTSSVLDELGLGDRFQVDLGEVRGFDYYTGLVFEFHAPGSGLELGGGGRYDSLVGRFGRELPAVGFYLSLDRLAELISQRDWNPPDLRIDEVALERSASAEGFRKALDARRMGRKIRVSSR